MCASHKKKQKKLTSASQLDQVSNNNYFKPIFYAVGNGTGSQYRVFDP